MGQVNRMLYRAKRTSCICFIRGLFFRGDSVRKAEPEVWDFITANIRSGRGACVDVGANRGEFSYLMATQVRETAGVYAFELHPENARLLQWNLWKYRNRVTVENVAVTDGRQESVAVFPGRSRSNAEWHISNCDIRHEKPPEFYAIARSLDTYFRSGQLLNLVKIDVEGAGAQVLAGMQRIIEESRPLIVIEIHNGEEWAGLSRLEERGYTLFDMKGLTPPPLPDRFGFHCIAAPKERPVTF